MREYPLNVFVIPDLVVELIVESALYVRDCGCNENIVRETVPQIQFKEERHNDAEKRENNGIVAEKLSAAYIDKKTATAPVSTEAY